MPAMLDDPSAPTIYRTSGVGPYPDPTGAHPSFSDELIPKQVILRDRVTVATIVPFSSYHQVPPSLLRYLAHQLNTEIEKGDTYPMIDTMSDEKFSSYWFQNFGAIMLLGNIERAEDVVEGRNWATDCLGTFYIKPNYPGRSSHVCNAGFLVTDAARNRGIGRLMGEIYIDWAPKLGYTYSVFNLVYETNVASCRIWDALGFKRIGRVKGCGNLKSYPGQLIDALIYGRDLASEGEELVSDERFDKIKFYLKTGKYPNGADRAEKSRLRSSATHYKLLDDGDTLMLKDKEVISDPQRQYEIAAQTHAANHGGINKTTATITESFHWVRIKETVSAVIRNCTECKELGKTPPVRGINLSHSINSHEHSIPSNIPTNQIISVSTPIVSSQNYSESYHIPFGENSHLESSPALSLSPQPTDLVPRHQNRSPLRHHPHTQLHHMSSQEDDFMPLDPQIVENVRTHLGGYNSHSHTSHLSHVQAHSIPKYNSTIYGNPDHTHHAPQQHEHDANPENDETLHASFLNNSMLVDDDPPDPHDLSHPLDPGHHERLPSRNAAEDDATDADLDMLIHDDDEPALGLEHGEVDVGGGHESESQLKAKARAAEAAMRGVVGADGDEDGDGEVSGYYSGFRDA